MVMTAISVWNEIWSKKHGQSTSQGKTRQNIENDVMSFRSFSMCLRFTKIDVDKACSKTSCPQTRLKVSSCPSYGKIYNKTWE